MEKNKFAVMYRVQSHNSNRKLDINKAYPIKRVIINGVGKIVWMQNASQYIYFSRTDKHSCYYLFNKVLKIVYEELARYKYENLNEEFSILKSYRVFSKEIYFSEQAIKRVWNFFNAHIKTDKLEIVTLTYLEGFTKFIEDCSIHNNKISGVALPRRADRSTCGGGYGLSDAWLELLKCTTVSTEVREISINKFFEVLLDVTNYKRINKMTLNEVIEARPILFSLTKFFTSKRIENPDLYEKDNLLRINRAVEKIKKEQLYNKESIANPTKYFREMKRSLREEVNEFLER